MTQSKAENGRAVFTINFFRFVVLVFFSGFSFVKKSEKAGKMKNKKLFKQG